MEPDNRPMPRLTTIKAMHRLHWTYPAQPLKAFARALARDAVSCRTYEPAIARRWLANKCANPKRDQP